MGAPLRSEPRLQQIANTDSWWPNGNDRNFRIMLARIIGIRTSKGAVECDTASNGTASRATCAGELDAPKSVEYLRECEGILATLLDWHGLRGPGALNLRAGRVCTKLLRRTYQCRNGKFAERRGAPE